MFTEELVFLDEDLRDYQEVLTFSFKHLRSLGYVKEGYLSSILAREVDFPTGLGTKVGINVAIPHTEVDFAEREAVVFIRLKDHVAFRHMVDPEEIISTRLVFNLVVKDPKNQVVFLTKLMKLFQNEALLRDLYQEADKNRIVTKLETFIKTQ